MEVDAHDVIRFQLVRDVSELERGRSSSRTRFEFGPDFVHQFFDGEKIRGHESPVLTMRFAAHSLFLFGPELISIRQIADADDILGKLKPFLPDHDDCQTDDLEVFKKKLTQPYQAFGKIVGKYSVAEKPNENPVDFQIRKADFSIKGLRKFHQRLRFFATCFIETASFIDDSDEKWSLLLLYRKRQPDESPNHMRFLDIAGYVSLYSFYSHPGGERLRLSQIVILPPYQKYGHGRRLLEAVYAEAIERNCFEVTVEDPAPLFQRLRDETDLRRILEMGYFQEDSSGSPSKKRRRSSLSDRHLHKWDASYAAEIRQQLKLTLVQIRRVYEMLKLHQLMVNGDDTAWTEFRLEVKRRLQKEYIGSTRPNPEERKRLLSTLYEELIQIYTPVVNKVLSKLSDE